MELFNKSSTKDKRNNLKQNMTLEEELLWKNIRKDQLGVRFRRQYGIGEYIVDFYCPKLRIVIEIDGGQHYIEKGLEYDHVREEYMKELGIKTLRFSNAEVRDDVEGVVEEIKGEI
ncbi:MULTISPECIES: endonuclease domain-containing protein [Psychrilyobacter]|uniref:DUF559 domain-containing protein n=1 Tax=Psychrilyobacter piezotolerans TaxID=2293438 RepID=A0ABX9KD25_9FUSO|nr:MULTISPECIES: endonuclease domain-containing protein [Psychrilyobacter]MCS5422667.1 endonuclease domain-containing protein [Psychrilyobacter sp. S5]NDI79195.1 endonuclease domain-containing protein [Psychrilyobacter piezotolerans]RDE58876.1 endonuclease domain-containing protein [Psychrilyobacter sp. S5]REI39386.1 DUF559 domain-containing protein [Psychrilyobacter piezotolerans]